MNVNEARSRVLVVDDDRDLRESVGRALGYAGYTVTTAANGADALGAVTHAPVDLIILDVLMPMLNGLDTCRALRSRGVATPVLVLTARDAVDDRIRGLDAGADDYLAKPFSFGELAARVRALIRRGGVDRPTVLRVGELVLDPASRRAWRGEDELTLSTKEFSLLELFLRHPDRVLSRTMILEHVWDFAYDGGSNVVDVYIRYLRDKVDRPFGRGTIQTVRGAGYRLDPTA